jgi:hypothetical protein
MTVVLTHRMSEFESLMSSVEWELYVAQYSELDHGD